VLTPGDAEDAKVGGRGGIWEGEKSRVKARGQANYARAGAARLEGGHGHGEEQEQGSGEAVGGT
jgi:hypothetical protein